MATIRVNEDRIGYRVVHPLNDAPEEKKNPDHLGRMQMSPSVQLSLMALRGYLIVMGLLVLYRCLVLAGLFGHAAGH